MCIRDSAYCEYEYLHTGYQMMNSPGLDCVDGMAAKAAWGISTRCLS